MAKATQSKNYDLNRSFKVDGDYIYSIDATNNLLAWIDFATSPSDRGPKGLTVSYTNSPGTFESDIGGRGSAINTLALYEAASQSASIADPGGILAMTDAPDGGTGSVLLDRKWSISAWVSLTDISTNKWIFHKMGTSPSGIWVYALSSGIIYIMIATDASNYIRAKTASAVAGNLVYPAGAHMVCTYDGVGLRAGIKLYLGGVEVTLGR